MAGASLGRQGHPGPARLRPTGPRATGPAVLGAFGGTLVALQSIYLVAYGDYLAPVAWTGWISSGQTLGGLGLLESAALFGLAFWLLRQPHHHVLLGIGSLTIALISLFSGGGFWLGALCAYVAGVMAIRLSPEPHRPPDPASVREAEDDPVAEADVLDAA